ncbi:uncharacterized protein LOC113782162 [Coffea eugenioides]|uniref:uncharacterized protein LOC113782162 n=1 Tax=Coffea eugenioides TaxID=49369 RepID=UPI000F613F38|nr:uncharacterized protein LOC113782162 [Coffea eugenioides]
MEALQPHAGGQAPSSPSFLRKSFAALFSNNTATPSLSVLATPSTHKGEPALIFSQVAMEKLAAPYRLALVGKFSRGRPKLEEFFAQFHSDADFHRVWARGIWYVHGHPMRVFKWTPSFHVDREPSVVLVWFQMPKLPLHLFHKETLFQIAEVVGVPLLVDAATLAVSRPSVARVCVEVDLMKQRPSRVWIGTGQHDGFWQELVPENLPPYCSHCFRQGHTEVGCHVLHPALKPVKVGGDGERLGQPAERGIKPRQRQREGVQDSTALVANSAAVEEAAATKVSGLEPPSETAALVESQAMVGAMVSTSQSAGATAALAEPQTVVAVEVAEQLSAEVVVSAEKELNHEQEFGDNGAVAVEGFEVVLVGGQDLSKEEDDYGNDVRMGSAERRPTEAHMGSKDVLAEEEELRELQERVGNLSPRGDSHMVPDVLSSMVSDHQLGALNLEPNELSLVRQVEPQKKGTKVNAMSSRILRSKEREGLWGELLREKQEVKPWFLVGDFNVILSAEEKRGGVPFRQADRMELAQFMSLAGVGDAGFSGSRYNWCNNRQGMARVWRRLDRLLINSAAMRMECDFTVRHLGRDPSDHEPLLLSAVTRLDGKPSPFRFLNVWTTKPGFLDVVKQCWSGSLPGSPLKVLSEKLRKMKQALRQWSRSSFGDIFLEIRSAEQKVAEAELAHDDNPSEELLIQLHKARARLRNALVVEEEYWKQKARVKWLADGDRNTAFFHSVVTERRRKSVIHRIRRTNGDWVDDEASICNEAVSFFQGLFTEEVGRASSDMLEVIPRVLNDQDNSGLTEILSMDEVKEVLFSMDGDSGAGPDGFTGKFFTAAWEVVAEDVHRAIESFFCGAELPATAIVLLPKVLCPQDFTQFRPISLCNFVNKAISKLLSVRLARVLPRIISPQQSGFVPGRQMADNFLLTQELLSDIRKPNRGGNVVLKLDMMKAYDRVSWLFLIQVLRWFGFSELWIDMVWRLVSNVWFSVIVNGSLKGFFKSTQGLRQGDPISPALFVIGAEVLSRSLNALAVIGVSIPSKFRVDALWSRT